MSDEGHQAVREWRTKAEGDWKAVLLLSRHPDCPRDIVCFHCQQHVEKLLKALLTLRGIEAPRSHDLKRLVQLAQPAVPELAGLSDRADSRVRTYSGGMKRRLNIAMALVGRPQLLFLDEPTVGVDPQSRNHVFETVERLNEEGMTVIYTTHYMEEADRLCSRLLILDYGRVIREGSPHDLKASIGDPEQVTLEDVFLNLTGRSLRG